MVDLLAVCAHPDDLEVCASGIFLKAKKEGRRTGLIVLTRGESGGHADMETRLSEAREGARLLGLDEYHQLDFPDAGLMYNSEAVEKVAPVMRACSPRIILTLHPDDYHPDHVAASQIARASAFTGGLNKYASDGSDWHYDVILYFSADRRTNGKRPDLIVDITEEAPQKRAICAAHASQHVEEFAMELSRRDGELIGVPYAEGLYLYQALPLHSLESLF
jgi:LmbE family N-acetylglucosaminyl deacetylase